MKKIFWTSACLLLINSFCLTAKQQEIPFLEFEEQILENLTEPLVLILSPQDELHIPIRMSGDIAYLKEPSQVTLKVQRPLFIKIDPDKQFFFSEDKNAWKPFIDFFGDEIKAFLGSKSAIDFHLYVKSQW